MGARQSAETKEAIRLVRVKKMSIASAAKRVGIWRTTLQRALHKANYAAKRRLLKGEK